MAINHQEAQKVIDLTGRKGLCDKFYGDINNFGFSTDKSLGQPNYRYTAKDGEVVSGICNPLRKYGYNSPSVGTLYPMTYPYSTFSETFIFDAPYTLFIAATATYVTGQPITFTTTGTLPAGLALSTIYYAIRTSSTQMMVATTLANALAGTQLDPVDSGSGTHTVTAVNLGISQIAATLYDSANNIPYMLTGISSGRIEILKFLTIDGEQPYVDRFLPTGATAGGDLEIYQINGVRTLFYTYNTGSAWRIGVKNLTSLAYTDNWLGTAGAVTNTFEPTSNGEMKLIPSGDGFMYVLNANHVHKIDGTTIGGSTGTITADILLAPDYFRFTHGVDFRNNLYIAVQKNDITSSHNTSFTADSLIRRNFATECGVYIWNRQNSFFNTSDYIPIQGVREIRALWISPKNDVRCITVSANGVTQIRKFNGSSFEVVKELGALAYPNYTDSLTVVGNFTVWLGYDGILYYHGSELPGESEFLFMMGSVGGTGIQNTFAGALLYAGGSGYATGGTEKAYPEAFHLTYVQSSVHAIKKFFPYSNNSITGGTTTAIYPDATPIYYPVTVFPKLSTIKNFTIFMAREKSLTAATLDATLSFYKNGDTTAFMTKTITTDDIMKGYKSIEINTPFIDTLQMSCVYSTAVAITNKRFNPAYAVINYEPTSTIN